MAFFDGKIEGLRATKAKWLSKDDIKAEFPTAGSRFKISFSLSWLVLMVVFAVTIPFTILSAAMGMSMDGSSMALTCFFGSIISFIGFFGIPISLIVFLIVFIVSNRYIEKNTTRITDDFVEVQYWKGQKTLPVQVTRIPYWYLKDVHEVTDEEWKRDLKMGNIFRTIGLQPFQGPMCRFHYGAFRKDLCTIQFSDKMKVHGYIDKQGSRGQFLTLFVSSLFAYSDRYVEEQTAAEERIYVSMSEKDRQKFKKMVEERKSLSSQYDPATGQSLDKISQTQEPLDDSWYTDLFANKK